MEYIRKIIYLQEYKSGTMCSSKAGYAKLEYRNRKWRLLLHSENAGIDGDSPIYIIAKQKDEFRFIYAGTLETAKGAFCLLNNETARFIRESEQLCGVQIGNEKHYLTGKCPEVLHTLPLMNIREPEQLTERLPQTANVAHAAEITEECSTESEEKTSMNFPPMYPFEDDEFECCNQIEPRDIGSLPPASWHLVNNSFLLQGYYNYRHLLYAKKQGKYYIGVPGQFHRREQYLASRFGFERFKGTQKKRITLGDFGYWIREC
jgi:hypothetical protein